MKVYQSNEIRNIALLGNGGAGKTTLTEALLLESGIIRRRGSVSAKNTVSDYLPVEQEYGYSVYATIFHTEANGKKLNFIDCPGSDDFSGAATTALSITDCALMLLNGQYGPEAGTINQLRRIEKLHKPVIFAVNHLDNEKCDFDITLERLRSLYGGKVVPIQYPLNVGPNFNAMIDVLMMKKYSWASEGGKPTIEDIPADQMDKATEWHNALVEAAAGNDEALMEKFFETEDLTQDEIREGIRKGLIACGICPVVCVSARQDMGVNRLMEFLGNVVPSPLDVEAPKNTQGKEVKPDDKAATSIYFFKTIGESHIGDVQYFKVMSGTLKAGDDMTNADRGSKERVAQLFVSAGNNRIEVPELHAGDIGCTVKLKDVRVGNTLNGKDADNHFDIVKYPNPKYSRAIRPENESDMEKMMSLINHMHEEDPTWLVEQSKELRQTIIRGQGEFHLRTLKWRLEKENMNVQYDEPRIPYRETITKAARADYRHKKQSGGAGQFGEVHLIVEPYTDGMPDPDVYRFGGQEYKISVKAKDEIPLEWGGKLVFINAIVGGSIDARFMPAILKGIMSRMEQGPLTGSYARDVRVIVYDGKMHPVDSNEISFMLAGRNAFSEAFKNAGPKILEPIYDVEVLVPADNMGDVMSDLQGRRAIIMGMDSEGGYQKLSAKVPLKEMSSYSTALSSLTGGRATFEMKFASYELVPTDVQTKLIKEFEEKNKEED